MKFCSEMPCWVVVGSTWMKPSTSFEYGIHAR